MKDNQSEHNMGEQIMDALSDALQGGDYSTLNRLVSQSVVNALNEVGKHISFMDYGETQNKEQQSQAQRSKEQAPQQNQTGQTWKQASRQDQAGQTWKQASRQDQAGQTWKQAPRQDQTRQAWESGEQARRQTQRQVR